MNPFQKTASEVATTLHTDIINGLSETEAAYRLKRDGSNSLPEGKKQPIWRIFFHQFQNPLIYILLIAATIIFFLDPIDASIITGVLLFNAIIGTLQEGRAAHILETLRHLISATAIVIRDHKRTIVQDEQLVVGDILILQDGEKVGADARLVEANNLLVNQASLSGESIGVYKSIDTVSQQVPLQYQKNMVFQGTYILSGSGKAIVTATGKQTELGKLGKTLEEIRTETPLKREIDRLSKQILFFILGICIFLLLFGIWMGMPLAELLIMLTALFICVIPEGLPTVLTLTLVTGASRMGKKNLLIKKLQAVEGLGRANVIIVDKTGTLTRNELMVSHLYTHKKEYHITGQGYHSDGLISSGAHILTHEEVAQELTETATACALMNHAQLEYVPQLDIFHLKGDPLEAALGLFAQKCGITNTQIEEYNLVRTIPFDPTQRYQAALYEKNGTFQLIMLGAPEVIYKATAGSGDVAQLEHMLEQGLRTVALATKQLNAAFIKNYSQLEHECVQGMKFLALVGIQDAIRPDVVTTVAQARQAGMRLVMATGDHKETALFVARAVGIWQEGDMLLDGETIETLTDAELQHKVRTTTVFARVSPEHKLRIVRAFQADHNVVAMTGDGVNDAPSLMAADLGIAMGSIGTEVAKQAADMVLLDDALSSIIEGITEGRHIFYTIKRTVLYFFTTNFAEILIVLCALLMGMPLPITAAQILWLNLIADGFLNAALAMEQREKGLLERTSYRKQHVVDRSMFIKACYMSIPMALGSLAVFYYTYKQDIAQARTLVVVTMTMFQWFNAWNCRSETLSIFQLGIFSNMWLILATVVVFALQLLLIYNPYAHMIFDTVPLSATQIGMIIVGTSLLLCVDEIRKWYMTHFKKGV